MVASILLACGLAVALSVVFTPAARAVARLTGFVDRPSVRKVHAQPVPYLGGLAIALATVLSVVFVRGLSLAPLPLLIGALALGAAGGIDDRRPIPIALRAGGEAFAALMATWAGVRIQLTGVEAFDVLITVVWIVGVTNAVNLVDNMDGLAAGLAALAAAGIAVVGGVQGQQVIAVVGAATAGACLGFFAFNWSPASIFMGDLGALFLGFLLAVATIEVEPAIPRVGSEFVPLLLLTVPLFDTATVVLGRLHHGVRPSTGGTDHLSHRLKAAGRSTRTSVVILLAAQAICTVLGVLVGCGVVNPWLGIGIASIPLITLRALTRATQVYSPAPFVPLPRAWFGGVSAVAAALFVVLTARVVLG